MLEKLIKLAEHFRSEIAYLIIGGFTTLISLAVFYLLNILCGLDYVAAHFISWAASIAFAYPANRKWVFTSKNKRVLMEAAMFVASRLFSLGLETALLLLSVEILSINENIAKPVINVLVIICNYITGRFVVFRKIKKQEHK